MKMMMAGLGLATVFLLGSCTGDPAISDIGYRGTWVRQNGRVVSRIAIARQGDRYLFRWTKYAQDADFHVLCEWDGRCEEWRHGRKEAEYQFTTATDPKTGRVHVECFETRLFPALRKLHYVDELVVEPGGKTLWSYTIERDGETFEIGKGPKRSFAKVADSIADPPRRAPS